jgi:hypothetical protein
MTARSAAATPMNKGVSKVKKLSSIAIENIDLNAAKLEGDTATASESEAKVEEKALDSKRKAKQSEKRTERPARSPARDQSRERKVRR